MALAKVNTAQFNAMCHQLSILSATPHQKVVKAEVGKVIEKAAEYTKSASAGKIRYRYQQFVPLSIDSYSPKSSRRYGGNLRGNYLLYYMENRYSNELWSRLRGRRTELVARKLAARGLAKQSWLQLAQALGVVIKVPGYVASAVASTGKQYKNVSARTTATKSKVRIDIVNAQPTVNAIGGAGALVRAMAGRIAFFNKNCTLAVFADIKKIARAYPGLKIKLPATE